MLAYLCETFFEMDLYSTLNSLAPLLTGGNGEYYSSDPSSEVITDFPPTDEPVYILGAKYSSLHELAEIRADVRSIIWVTYRRGFPSIGDSNMTADSGWGCMLRTGQMVLAQAFSKLHLGRDWRWKHSDSSTLHQLLAADANQDAKAKAELAQYLKYRAILKLFLDLKTAPYSIHQIALMGACEGKQVGEWFGPNTVAQVLKKLSVYDKFNDIYIHVALDNMVFIDDIKKNCKSRARLAANQQSKGTTSTTDGSNFWRPLILFIPLRLGLTEINPVYFRALKSTFAFPQTLGILGGRPNHALYFVGCVGDELVYLDPHTTQPVVSLADDVVGEFVTKTTTTTSTASDQSSTDDHCAEHNDSLEHSTSSSGLVVMMDDVSYHCERASRMSLHQLDPSIALGFLCRTEEEFDQWATLTLHKLIQEEQQPLFEVMAQRPANWPTFEDEEFDTPKINTRTCTAQTHQQQQQPSNNSSVVSSASTTSAQDTSFIPLEDDEEYEIIEF